MAFDLLPVTIVSGFLGAGKTTLVNRLLTESGERIGVIVNEFGEEGIDGELILADEQPLIEISNGCICCTVRKDLGAAVSRMLAEARDRIDRLVIETSGLADPAPVLQTFLAEADLLERVALESVITLVDARHALRQLDDPIAQEQVAFADLVILNKVELADDEALRALREQLRRLHHGVEIIETSHARVSLARVLGTRRFSLPDVLAVEPDLLAGGEHEHEHDASIASVCVASDEPLDAARFQRWVHQLVQRDSPRLMRMKGILDFHGEARRYHFHGVHMLLDSRPGPRWRAGEARASRLVFIGRALDPAALREGLLDCRAPQHHGSPLTPETP